MFDTKYPIVTVQLTGQDGNAFYVLGLCQIAARKAGIPQEDINVFLREAKSGDYNHLLRVCMKYFDVQ